MNERVKTEGFFIASENPYTKEIECDFVFADEGIDRNGLMSCYAHCGQHGSASPKWVAEQRDATPDEYQALALELAAIGYDITLVNRPAYLTAAA